MALNPKIERDLQAAIQHFWTTRKSQQKKQGTATGLRDAGSRGAVTGGRQMDGFVALVKNLLCENGLEKADVYCEKRIELPGWYRPEKRWDLLVVSRGKLLAGIEFKSHIGSFGNNYNNRTEEAIGSATDIWAAYREGAFKPSARPWLGYLMLLEDAPGSLRPVRAKEPHFKVFPEFKDASYSKRYEILLTKLVRERLYDAACFLRSDARRGRKGEYIEPAPELCFETFISSLLATAIASEKVKD
ncbi:MAG TPA: PaeR7I family type II restriction endonuclease [Candidatus Dormibacteraeota bacterium]|nr:PaeR7I family type II restriction endonuclease [Candidatus Dormibacteraeota bacterium]